MHTFILCVLQSERLSKRSSQVDLWHTRPVQKKCTRSMHTGSIWFKSRSRVKDICLWELSIPQRDGAGLLRLYILLGASFHYFNFNLASQESGKSCGEAFGWPHRLMLENPPEREKLRRAWGFHYHSPLETTHCKNLPSQWAWVHDQIIIIIDHQRQEIQRKKKERKPTGMTAAANLLFFY